MNGAGRVLGMLALALVAAAVAGASSIFTPARSGAEAGSMHSCPAAGKWSIAVWAGADGTAAADALAACGDGAVAAAYSLDSQTGGWSRWFAGKPEVSNLPSLGEMQGLLALGGSAAVGALGGDTLAAAVASGQLHNCPPAGQWSIAVWEGESGATAAEALAACGDGAVAAAYALDAQTGGWSRWFAGKPEVSNLPPLGETQGLLALGAASSPTPTPSASPTPTPGGPAGPVAGGTYSGQTSQGLLVEFDIAADGLGITRVRFGFEGLLYNEPCEGLMNMTFGRAQPIEDNSFTINDTDYTMTGRFDSATTAAGDLQVHIPDRWADPGCFSDPLTWTAANQ